MTECPWLNAGVVAVGIGRAYAAPTFQPDPTSNRRVSISNLYNDPTCDLRAFRGVVTERQFEDDGLTVEGFILELRKGSRDFIDVGLDTRTPDPHC